MHDICQYVKSDNYQAREPERYVLLRADAIRCYAGVIWEAANGYEEKVVKGDRHLEVDISTCRPNRGQHDPPQPMTTLM